MYYKSTGDMLSTFHRCLMAFCLIFGNNNCDTDVFSPIVPVVLGKKNQKPNLLQNKIFHLRCIWMNQGLNLPGKMGFKCLENRISLFHLIFGEIILNWDVSELTAPSEFTFSSCYWIGEQRPRALLPFYCHSSVESILMQELVLHILSS